MTNSILYSFRRCPYAMRARLAIAISGIQIELREVVLRDKPQALLDISPKATVPVLLTPEQHIIEESLDIMLWALRQSDPQEWLSQLNDEQLSKTMQLIKHNDSEFKHYLDRYKYADRYPEHSQHYYRQQAEKTLQILELNLSKNGALIRTTHSLADIALLPFIRQFAFVDKAWFDAAPYPLLQHWLSEFLAMPLFDAIMSKYPQWQSNNTPIIFPAN